MMFQKCLISLKHLQSWTKPSYNFHFPIKSRRQQRGRRRRSRERRTGVEEEKCEKEQSQGTAVKCWRCRLRLISAASPGGGGEIGASSRRHRRRMRTKRWTLVSIFDSVFNHRLFLPRMNHPRMSFNRLCLSHAWSLKSDRWEKVDFVRNWRMKMSYAFTYPYELELVVWGRSNQHMTFKKCTKVSGASKTLFTGDFSNSLFACVMWNTFLKARNS